MLLYLDKVRTTGLKCSNCISDKGNSQVATIVVRGSTEGLMDDVERSLDDGVNTFKALTRDGRVLPGAGATEIELAKQLMKYGEVIDL